MVPPMSADTIVVLDAMGVLYQPADDVADLLIPFAREQGCGKSGGGDHAALPRCIARNHRLGRAVPLVRAVCSSMTDWKT